MNSGSLGPPVTPPCPVLPAGHRPAVRGPKSKHCPRGALLRQAITDGATPSFLKPALVQHFPSGIFPFRANAAVFTALGTFPSSSAGASSKAAPVGTSHSCLLFFKHLESLWFLPYNFMPVFSAMGWAPRGQLCLFCSLQYSRRTVGAWHSPELSPASAPALFPTGLQARLSYLLPHPNFTCTSSVVLIFLHFQDALLNLPTGHSCW